MVVIGAAVLGAVPTMAGMSAQETGFPGVSALSGGQRVQLGTAVDGGLPDEPALYALLANVAGWDTGRGGPTDDIRRLSGAGYAAALADPAAMRGELVVVEGKYAGRQRRMKLLRPNPAAVSRAIPGTIPGTIPGAIPGAGAGVGWGEALTEWGVVVEASPSEAGGSTEVSGANSGAVSGATSGGVAASGGGAVVMVYFVDPEGVITPPRGGEGARVRVVGRFYKLWTDRDASGRATMYPVVVAKEFTLEERAADGGGLVGISGGTSGLASGGGGVAAVLVAAVVGLLMMLWWVRRAARSPGSAAARRERVRQRLLQDAERYADENDDASIDEPALPEDPAEALRALDEGERQLD